MKDSLSGDTEREPAVDILIETEAWRMLPEAEDIVRRTIASAATSEATIRHRQAELSVLLCDDQTMAGLNARWRGQEKPTNVLSFPAPLLPGDTGAEKIPLGDIAIAYETLAREAHEQGKPVSDHLSHLIVHGFLHLLGYDHQSEGEAEQMEQLERGILARIGIANPYAAGDADI
jgi:probable rRNA maturation factor